MKISAKAVNDVKVLQFDGNVDTQTSPEAEARLTDLINQGAKKIIVDFEKVGVITSTGLRVLLVAAKQLKPVNGELRICCLNGVVQEVFYISGFTKLFKIFGSEAEALQDF